MREMNNQLCLVEAGTLQKEDRKNFVMERIQEYGTDNCFDYELLSVITSIKVEELRQYKNLAELEERVELIDCTELQKTKLKAIFTVARRYSKLSRGNVKTIKSPEDAYKIVADDLRFQKKEIFKCILLDTKNQVLDTVDVSIGSLSSSIVHPREVFKIAILNSANAVIFAHNHPSSIPTESSEDVETNRRLVECGKLLGISVLDHIIVGDGNGRYVSLKEKGLM